MKANNPKKITFQQIILSYVLLVMNSMLATGCSKDEVSSKPIIILEAKIYYVSTTGSDSNKGSVDTPFRGINTALNKAKPGDTILVRGGRYYEKIMFPKSGTREKNIILKAYPGETPIIDGTGLSITGKEALVTIRKVNFIVFHGFDVCNYKSSAPWVNINGILVDEGSSNIIIRKNKIYNIEHNVRPEDGRSGHGIEIIGNTSVPMKNILVEENEIHDCNTGYSENLTINGYVDGFVIRKNKIYNAENIGIDAAGGYAANPNPAFNYARNGTISENELYDIDMTTGPIGGAHGHGAIGIYIDGARNILVERNKVYNTDRGIGIVSETDAYPTEGCIVRNNFVYNCWRTGIYLGGYLNYTSGGTNNCYILNNTVAFNNRVLGAFEEIEGEIRLTENCKNNVIKNNIIFARAENDVFIHKYTNSGSNNVIDHNLYYTDGTSPRWIWNGKSYDNYDNWRAASQADPNSIFGVNPLFLSSTLPDLHIQSSSPAKNSGLFISLQINGDVDIDGNARMNDGKLSIGAHQVQ